MKPIKNSFLYNLAYLIIILVIGKSVYWGIQNLLTAQTPKTSIWLPFIVSNNVATLVPQITPTPPTATPPPPTVMPSLAMQALPLAVGNTWVYSATYYKQRVITPATYIITDTVVLTQIYNGLFGAEIQRTTSATSDTPPHEHVKLIALEHPFSGIYSYVISDTEIYRQDKLDMADLSINRAFYGILKYPLVYDLPFKDESRFNCWYPDLGEGEDNCQMDGQRFGYYYVNQGPISLHSNKALWTMHNYTKEIFEPYRRTPEKIKHLWENYLAASPQFPIEDFENCYVIRQTIRGGGYNQWFCLGIGIVHTEWLSQSQSWTEYGPIGYDIHLMSYSIAK